MLARARRLIPIALLLLSLAYNAAWLISAPALQSAVCTSQRAQILSAALDSKKRGEWDRAAILYGYLAEVRSRSEDYCSPVFSGGDVSAPLAALVIDHQARSVDPEAARKLDTELFRDEYTSAQREVAKRREELAGR